MSFTSWLRNVRSAFAQGQTERNHRRRSLRVPTHRPHLEVLEDRCLLSFTPAAGYPVGPGPESLLAADFNGDGRLDLAAANHSGNSVSVLLGNGDGTFQAAQHNGTG